jgi:hypothetical protein
MILEVLGKETDGYDTKCFPLTFYKSAEEKT